MKATKAVLGIAAAMLVYSSTGLAQDAEISAFERVTGLPPTEPLSPAPAARTDAEISAFERITGLPADEPVATQAREEPATVKVLDAAIVRPFGVVATVLGAGLFAVAVGPAALAEGHFPQDLAQAAVGNPFYNTFQRPLGDYTD